MFRRCDSELIVEAMMPNFSHIIPFVSGPMGHWTLQTERIFFV
jgi:hypothetical protein